MCSFYCSQHLMILQPIVKKSVNLGALVDPYHFQGHTAYIYHNVFDKIL